MLISTTTHYCQNCLPYMKSNVHDWFQRLEKRGLFCADDRGEKCELGKVC